ARLCPIATPSPARSPPRAATSCAPRAPSACTATSCAGSSPATPSSPRAAPAPSTTDGERGFGPCDAYASIVDAMTEAARRLLSAPRWVAAALASGQGVGGNPLEHLESLLDRRRVIEHLAVQLRPGVEAVLRVAGAKLACHRDLAGQAEGGEVDSERE